MEPPRDAHRTYRQVALLHPRLVLTLALMPFTIGAVAVWMLFATTVMDEDHPLVIAGVFSMPLLVFYGGALLVWRKTIRWNVYRRQFPLGWFVTLGGAILLTAPLVVDASGPGGLLPIVLLSTIGVGVAFATTFHACWTPPAPRPAKPLPCPNCQHDLRNAGTCTCPACGQTFTLLALAQSAAVAEALGFHTDDASAATHPSDDDA
jgi:hypothetical protein